VFHLIRLKRISPDGVFAPYTAQDEFTLAAIAQNLRRLAKLAAHPPPAG
jgi:hypothetical protein